MKVAMYCRVGNVENQEKALEEQKARLEAFCEEHGYEVSHTITALDKGTRILAFNEAKQLIELEVVDGIVAEKFSDLARNSTMLKGLRDFAKEHNAVVVDVHDRKL